MFIDHLHFDGFVHFMQPATSTDSPHLVFSVALLQLRQVFTPGAQIPVEVHMAPEWPSGYSCMYPYQRTLMGNPWISPIVSPIFSGYLWVIIPQRIPKTWWNTLPPIIMEVFSVALLYRNRPSCFRDSFSTSRIVGGKSTRWAEKSRQLEVGAQWQLRW